MSVCLARVFCLTGLFDTGLLLLLLSASTVIPPVAWRRQITSRAVALGLTASAIAFATGGVPIWRFGFVSKPALIVMLAMVPPMFVVGGLLVARTGVGAVRVLEGRYGAALQSFLRGCLLFVPLGLANAAESARRDLRRVNRWWHPVALPAWSGITEEVVFRTVVVCLAFALIRTATRWSAAKALALVFSAIVFRLGHGRALGNLLSTGLGYGLPRAVVFARRDWEHAVGGHYTVNVIPWVMALLRT